MSEFASTIGQHFAYASGRLGVLKQLLAAQSDIDRLLGCSGKSEAEGILTELKLTSKIDQGISTWPEILVGIEAWIRDEVIQMCPADRQPTFQILWLEGDQPLLAFLLKNFHGLTSAISQQPVSGFAAYGEGSLQALVEEGVKANLPMHLVEFVNKTKALSAPSAKAIDHLTAQYVANTQLSLAKVSGSAHILRFTEHLIDISNIRTALRLARADKKDEEGTTPNAYLEGGVISTKEFKGDSLSVVVAIERSTFESSLAEAIRQNPDDINNLEREFAEVIAKDIALMWNVPLTIEPLFAFAALALSQLKLIRVILIGKSNSLSPQEIKQVTPPFISASHYVI